MLGDDLEDIGFWLFWIYAFHFLPSSAQHFSRPLYLYLLDTVQYSIGKYQVSTIWRVNPPLDPNLADTPRTKSLTISHLID
jgi:hypothetical protein